MRYSRGLGWMSVLKFSLVTLLCGLLFAGCDKKDGDGDRKEAESEKSEKMEKTEAPGLPKGVGTISHVELGGLDEALAAKGEKLFSGTCSACHKMDKRYVGPALAGVTVRRSPEWIMNMIMNPAGMTKDDSTAKALLGEFMVQMSVNATEEDARAVLEYFRKQDQQITKAKE